MKIAIIKHAGNYMANQVLQGVYGTVVRAEPEAADVNPETGEIATNESSKGRFTHAPEFSRISHLFSYIGNGGALVDLQSIEEIDVADELAADFKANLMHQLGCRWEGLYERMGGGGDSMSKALLDGESAQVRNGVRSHLASMGAQVYEIIVKVPAQSRFGSGEYFSMDSLLRGMAPVVGASFEVTDVHAIGAQFLGSTVPQPQAQEILPEQAAIGGAPVDQQRPWVFEGHYAQADLAGKFHVVATSAESAAAYANFVLNEKSMRESILSQHLTLTPVSLQNVRQGDVVQYQDVESDLDEDDDFDDRRERTF